MEPEEMRALANRAERSGHLDLQLRSALAQAACSAFPELAELAASEPVEQSLRLVAHALPNWYVSFEGTASHDGAWTCTLREYDARDDDAVIGIGSAPEMAVALHAAFLRVAAARAEGSL